MTAYYLRTIKVLERPFRLFQSPLEGPDCPWAAAMEDFEDYAERLSLEEPNHAIYVFTPAGQELVVSSFVVDGILDHQAQQGSEQARRARAEYNDGMAELFAMQHADMPHREFRPLCVVAAARHEPPAGRHDEPLSPRRSQTSTRRHASTAGRNPFGGAGATASGSAGARRPSACDQAAARADALCSPSPPAVRVGSRA